MRIQASTMIHAPIDEVYKALAEIETWPSWSNSVVAVRWISGGPMSMGATFRETTRFLGRTIEQTHEVVEYTPPHSFSYTARSGPFQQVSHFGCFQADSGTRVTLVSEGDTGSFLRPMKPVFAWIGGRQLERELQRFARWLERRNSAGT